MTMKFKVEFDCNNDAFVQFPEGEVANILENLAHAVRQGDTGGAIYDSNGNGVGKWEFTDA
jgi:hypothetical protein